MTMDTKTVRLLFEQSGTFKSVFKDLGINAISYDIENRFNQTDVVIDLFDEIEKCFKGELSIFDDFDKNDLLIAFFPCTYFSGQNNLFWNRKFRAFANWDKDKIDNYIHNRLNEREYYFDVFKKFNFIIQKYGFKCIIENPSRNNFLLSREGFKKPALIIENRSHYGDNHIKPTMFYFINLKPRNNFINLKIETVDILKHNLTNKGIIRSQIHPNFAYNFIRKHILKEEVINNE